MKNLLILASSALCVLLVVAVPLPAETDQNVQLLQIPLEGNKELDILSLPENAEGRLTERNKRTIGVLRQLFPELSKKVEQVIEESVQLVLPIIFRNIGPLLLRGGLGGLSGGGGTTSNDDEDEDDDSDDTNDGNSNTSVKEGDDGRKVSISLPTFPPDTDEDEDEESENDTDQQVNNNNQIDKKTEAPSTTNQDENNTIKNDDRTNMASSGNRDIDLASLTDRLDSYNRVVRQTSSQTTKQTPTTRTTSDSTNADANTIATAINSKEDSNGASSDVTESKAPAIDELTLEEDQTEEDRNKRFLSFGFGGSNGSGGSGNFLFDIIRRSFDRVARAAGTIYRVAAGTESFDLQINKQATRSTDDDTDFDPNNDDNDTTSRILSSGFNDNGLVGGSAGSEQTDEKENAPDGSEITITKSADGYTEGIPGPVTRLFVLANRGIANLIQDLILRIAQTSERVVNFKARLITSLI